MDGVRLLYKADNEGWDTLSLYIINMVTSLSPSSINTHIYTHLFGHGGTCYIFYLLIMDHEPCYKQMILLCCNFERRSDKKKG